MKKINKFCLVGVFVFVTALMVVACISIWESPVYMLQKALLGSACGLMYCVFLGLITSGYKD